MMSDGLTIRKRSKWPRMVSCFVCGGWVGQPVAVGSPVPCSATAPVMRAGSERPSPCALTFASLSVKLCRSALLRIII